jgi:hypothetical protein
MLEIIVILAVAYILIPLFELILAERVLFLAKLFLYVLVAAWLLYVLLVVGKVV